MAHRKIAYWSAVASVALIALDGWAFSAFQHIAYWHAVYCVWMTAITVGGDVAPTSGPAYACLAVAPVWLVAAIFSFFTSGLAAVHVRDAADEIKEHSEALHQQTRVRISLAGTRRNLTRDGTDDTHD